MSGAAGVPGVELRRMRGDGVELRVAVTGPEDGRPVLLLHGFPELWYTWRRQIPALASAGFRVVAPDGRGYGGSDQPSGRGAYRMDRLAGDVLAVMDEMGWPHAAVVGHDWGGAVGWRLAERFPDRVERLAVLNCPHPAVLSDTLRRDPAQLLRSLYVLFFQLPALPELALGRRGAALERAMRGTSARGSLSLAELEVYREAWSRPGALTSMLNWYRGAPLRPRWPAGSRPQRPIRAPTLLLWGTGDRFLGEALIEPTLARCADARLVRLEGASHWLPWEAAEAVNRELLGFLG